MGLGATPTTLALRDQDMVREALGLPRKVLLRYAYFPLAIPWGGLAVTRKPVETIMRFDRWFVRYDTS